MAHIAIEIAEAVKTEMNGHVFSQAFTAVRAYRPSFELKDLSGLEVTVVPKSFSGVINSRASTQDEYEIDIAVMKKTDILSDNDDMMSLVQEISDFFRLRRLTEYSSALWVGVDDIFFDPATMAEKRLFMNILTLTFKIVR